MQIAGEPQSTLLRRESTPSGCILVVDSDGGVAETIAAVLRHDGYSVAIATSYPDAVSMLQSGTFDLLLADLRGEETSERLLKPARALSPELVVIVLARFTSFETALNALQAGAYDYLVKPVDVDELRVRIRRGLEHRQLANELTLRVVELEEAHARVHSFNAQLRQQVDEATAELRLKLQELDESNRQLRQTQEEHDRFVAMVAHEMRGPLNPIINYAQLAKRQGLSPATLEHYADIIIEQAYRLNRLVDDLQTATRLSTGHFTLRRERCDVADAVAELVDNFVASVHERHFTFERPLEPILAEVDRDRIVQAVRNLLDNAVKYSAEGGDVEIRVWRNDSTVYISVRDHGAGIPPAEIPRIFEAFTRLHRESEVAGSGLGLYITRGIVTAHGGQLTVSNGSGSERMQGAIFTIEIPAEIPAADSAIPTS
ncbi:MAG: ATP-binding protein [Ktedonobacterales bacterium]